MPKREIIDHTKGHRIIVGWAHDSETFFGEVLDKKGVSVFSFGQFERQLPTVDDLEQTLKGWTNLSSAVKGQLDKDRLEFFKDQKLLDREALHGKSDFYYKTREVFGKLFGEEDLKITPLSTLQPGMEHLRGEYGSRHSALGTREAAFEVQANKKGEREFRFKKGGALGFVAGDNYINIKQAEGSAVLGALATAKELGWQGIDAAGSNRMKRLVWLHGSAEGMVVRGYTPNEHDKQVLNQLQASRKVATQPLEIGEKNEKVQQQTQGAQKERAPKSSKVKRQERIEKEKDAAVPSQGEKRFVKKNVEEVKEEIKQKTEPLSKKIGEKSLALG